MQELEFFHSGPAVSLGVGDLTQESDGVRGRMTLGAAARGPDGSTSVGALGVLVDEVQGYAIMGSLAQGAWSISTEIWIDVLGELPATGAGLTATASPIVAGSFASGEVWDDTGRLVATCRQRGREVPAAEDPGGATQLARSMGSGQSRPESLEELLGLIAEGDATVLYANVGLANPRLMLHGGVSLAASEAAAARSRLEAGCLLPTSSVHIVHTRGVPTDAQLVLQLETRHAGRSLWVTDVVGTVGGKVSTVATVTAQ